MVKVYEVNETDTDYHRYRFRFMFPWGDVLENSFAFHASTRLQGDDLDEYARACWAESLRRMVGTPLPERPDRMFNHAMAAEAAQGATFTVLRPGQRAGVPMQ